MDKEQLKQNLAEEGFVHVYEWYDEPGTEYPPHVHADKVVVYILRGGITFRFGNKSTELKEGDRFDVPAGREHSATVGSSGCEFLVGEMIQGDS